MKCFACGYCNEKSEFLELGHNLFLKDKGNITLFGCPNCGVVMIDDWVIEELKKEKG